MPHLWDDRRSSSLQVKIIWNMKYKKQFQILKVQAAFAIKLWISGQTCPMKANFVFANLIFCLIWSNWDDQNSSFEPPYSFLSQGSKGEGEEGGGGPEGEGVQGGVQRALLPRVPVSSSRRSNCGSECLSVFLSEPPEFQWVYWVSYFLILSQNPRVRFHQIQNAIQWIFS